MHSAWSNPLYSLYVTCIPGCFFCTPWTSISTQLWSVCLTWWKRSNVIHPPWLAMWEFVVSLRLIAFGRAQPQRSLVCVVEPKCNIHPCHCGHLPYESLSSYFGPCEKRLASALGAGYLVQLIMRSSCWSLCKNVHIRSRYSHTLANFSPGVPLPAFLSVAE